MLSDTQIKTAKPDTTRPFKLYDTDGLYLLVNPTGGKLWRFKYRYLGKEKLLSLGKYPHTSLLLARKARDDAKRLLATGVDPSQERQEQRDRAITDDKQTFACVAKEWLERQAIVMAPPTHTRAKQILDDYVLPMIGKKPVGKVTAPDVLSILTPLEQAEKYNTVQRTRHRIGQILRYADATGRYTRDVTASLRGILISPPESNYPAVTSPKELAGLLKAIDTYPGRPLAKVAMQLQSLVFVRPGELVTMEWNDIDLDNGLWNIPKSKMKMRRDHIVPLSRQALDRLRWVKAITGGYAHVLPNERDHRKPMHRGSINRSLELIGYAGKHTAHGFRATARTILAEHLGYAHSTEWIELQLAHEVKDPNGRAYNRTAFLQQRAEMMQKWADYLDSLRSVTQ